MIVANVRRRVEARFDPRRILKVLFTLLDELAPIVEARFDPRRILKVAHFACALDACQR